MTLCVRPFRMSEIWCCCGTHANRFVDDSALLGELYVRNDVTASSDTQERCCPDEVPGSMESDELDGNPHIDASNGDTSQVRPQSVYS